MLNSKGVLKVQYQETTRHIENRSENLRALNERELYVCDCILNNAAYAACDGLKKDYLFGRCYAIMGSGRSQSIRKSCTSNR